jgi:hypothetical protein
MVSNRLWLYNDTNINVKDKPSFLINLQKTIINTVVDLLNSIVEANFEPNKNYLYEIINGRIGIKLLHIFNDEQLLKRIEINSNKLIKFDENTKKVTILTKKIGLINLDTEFRVIENINETCDIAASEISKNPFLPDTNSIDILTNCSDGKFHSWIFKSSDLICNLCGKSYNELIKLISISSTEKPSTDYLDKLKIINLKKLAKKYCITGDTHEFNNLGICNKCKIDINTFNPSDKELKLLEKNLEIKTNELSILQINQMKKYNELQELEEQKNKKILNKLFNKYEKETNNKLENYVIDFVDKLSKVLGQKIKVQDKTIYLKETVYIIDHDYFGNLIKEPFFILSSEDKINLVNNHPILNKDILYYKDKANKVYVYYDSITHQHLGYSEDNKNIKKTKNNASLKIELSIKDCIMYFGYENQYYNIYHVNKDYQKESLESLDLGDDTKEVVLKIIRNRMNNLKQIIMRTQSIIHNIRNSGKVTSIYSLEEKEIVNEFTKKLKKFNIKDETGHNNLFKNYKYIIYKLPISYNIPDNLNIKLNKNYLDINNINIIANSDSKLIFYLIYNFNKLLDYNKQPAIQSELSHMLIKIIRYLFNIYYRPYSNYNIRKFDFLLINETPYVDETLKVIGHYQELLTQHEIDDPSKKDEDYSIQEAVGSLDIDDYEQDDDIDGAAEALDGYE